MRRLQPGQEVRVGRQLGQTVVVEFLTGRRWGTETVDDVRKNLARFAVYLEDLGYTTTYWAPAGESADARALRVSA